MLLTGQRALGCGDSTQAPCSGAMLQPRWMPSLSPATCIVGMAEQDAFMGLGAAMTFLTIWLEHGSCSPGVGLC